MYYFGDLGHDDSRFLSVGDLHQSVQHFLVFAGDGEGGLAMVVVDRHMPQFLMSLQGISSSHCEACLSRVDDGLQFAEMPAIVLLGLELEDGLAEGALHLSLYYGERPELLKSEGTIDRRQAVRPSLIESNVQQGLFLGNTHAGAASLLLFRSLTT